LADFFARVLGAVPGATARGRPRRAGLELRTISCRWVLQTSLLSDRPPTRMATDPAAGFPQTSQTMMVCSATAFPPDVGEEAQDSSIVNSGERSPSRRARNDCSIRAGCVAKLASVDQLQLDVLGAGVAQHPGLVLGQDRHPTRSVITLTHPCARQRSR